VSSEGTSGVDALQEFTVVTTNPTAQYGFVALVGTLIVVPTISVAGMALILGIDRFLSTFRALVNMIGNGVGTIVVASWEYEIEGSVLTQALATRENRTIDQQINDQQIMDQQIPEGEERESIG
jgi:aerobic C4-dicarboxylate transport protein